MKRGTGRGFGKTILIGDQFVRFGISAIGAAIPFETETTVEIRDNGAGWMLDDKRDEVPGYKKAKEQGQIKSFNQMIDTMGIDTDKVPIHITVGGSLLAGSGVGASAAICVSFVRACNELFDLGMDTKEINYVAWKGEFGYHGVPSGVDNTISTYGGVIEYKIVNDQKMFRRINLDESVEVVLGNSRVTADTASYREHLYKMREEEPHRFEKRLAAIRLQVDELKEALEAYDFAKVGEVMNENHRILIDMGLSHDRLIELCDMANTLGAYGAKVTGGGLGGYMVAITPGKNLQEKVAQAFEAKDAPVIRATIGNPPTDPSSGETLS